MDGNSEGGWAAPAGGTQASPGSIELPLFQSPFYKDWIVLLSLFGAWVTARSSFAANPSLIDQFSAVRLLDTMLQTLVLVGVQISVLGLLPAYVRMKIRFRRLQAGNGISPPPNLKGKHYSALVLIASLLAVPFAPVLESAPPQTITAAASSPASTPRVTKIARACFDNGPDTVCLEGQQNGNNVSVDFSYQYDIWANVDIYNIAEWRWTISVNCLTRSGSLRNFRGITPFDSVAPIPNYEKNLMSDGLEAEWVPLVLTECR